MTDERKSINRFLCGNIKKQRCYKLLTTLSIMGGFVNVTDDMENPFTM